MQMSSSMRLRVQRLRQHFLHVKSSCLIKNHIIISLLLASALTTHSHVAVTACLFYWTDFRCSVLQYINVFQYFIFLQHFVHQQCDL